MQILVELFDVVVFVLVETHLDTHNQRTAVIGPASRRRWFNKLFALIYDGVFVYELLEAPVVGVRELVHRVLDVDLVVLVVHDREHHLNLDRLVRHVLEKHGQEVLAVDARTVRVEDETPQ